MFIHLTKAEILRLKHEGSVEQVSRWDTLQRAESYYSKAKGYFTAYNENKENLTNAYSTPVKVYKLK